MISPRLVFFIDREVGSRICRLFTEVGRFTRRGFEPPQKTKKILFIKISEMGSTVLAYPAIQTAQKKFPEAELYFLTFKGNEKIIEILGLIPPKNVLTIDIFSLKGLFVDLVKVIMKLRREKIDAVLDFELLSRISAILGFLVKAPCHIGFQSFHMEGLYRGGFFTHKVLYNHYQHTSLAFYTLVEALSSPKEELPLLKKQLTPKLSLPQIKINDLEKRKLFLKLQKINPGLDRSYKLVILNTHASDFLPLRRWPQENFIKLAKKLLQNPKVVVILIGVSGEKKYISLIEKGINHPFCLNMVGKTSLDELLALFSISGLLITNDSGPAHFAALTPIQIISLFGPETPQLYAPLTKNNHSLTANLACSPCVNTYNARRSACNNNYCMSKISVEEVYNLSQKLLLKPKVNLSSRH